MQQNQKPANLIGNMTASGTQRTFSFSQHFAPKLTSPLTISQP